MLGKKDFLEAGVLIPFYQKIGFQGFFEEFDKNKDLVAFGSSCILYSSPILAKFASKFLLTSFLILDKFFSGDGI